MKCLVSKVRLHGRTSAALAATCAVVMAPATVLGQAFFVPQGNNLWSDPANWTTGALPSNQDAIIHAGREATINIANPDPVNFLRIADNNVDPQPGPAVDGTLNIEPGAELNIANQVLLAAGGPSDNHGVINQTGGTFTVGDALFLAFDPTHTANYNLSAGILNTGNLWFRFGNGTLTQTGGEVNAAQVVLAEGGGPLSSSLYDLQGGTLNVAGAANIGKAPGPGDPFGGSYGTMNISGGIATFGSLLFGNDTVDLSNDPTDVIRLSGSGILRVSQENYSEADALADIAAGKILGANLVVTTLSGAAPLTQIAVIPEPTSIALSLLTAVAATFVRRRFV